jgi:penicillin-binding protein 1C
VWFEKGTISLVIEDRRGELLHEEQAANERFGTWLPGDQLPPAVAKMTLAAEDHRLYAHRGVDMYAIFRAAWSNLRRGRRVSGASTLAMQLVRQLRYAPRSYANKIKEMYWAHVLTRELGSDGILREYLNRAPYGNRVQGIQRASLLYFDRPAADLSDAQAAFLAALPWSPSRLNPFREKGRARAWKRAKRILARAYALGWLSKTAYEEALNDPLAIQEKPRRILESIHLTEAIAASWRRLPKRPLKEQIARIQTTLDLRLQQGAAKILQSHLAALAGRDAGVGAVVVMDHRSGEILAYVGSHDYFDKKHHGAIDYIRTPRHPGSTLKPFIYGEAIQKKGFTGATLLSDIATAFLWKDGAYHPQNYDESSLGPVRLRVALGNSRNIPALHALAKAGIGEVLGVLRKLGLSTFHKGAEEYGLGLALGNGEARLLDLVRAYGILAREGRSLTTRWLHRAFDSLQRPISPSLWKDPFLQEPIEEGQIIPREIAQIVAHILADPIARLPSFGRYSSLETSYPSAVKTGTSQGHRDAWTIGFSDRVVVGCWVGNHDQRRMKRVSGGLGCGEIYQRVMDLAMKMIDVEKPAQAPLPPSRWKRELVCSLSGFPASKDCPGQIEEYFPPQHKHLHAHCPFHRRHTIDLRNGLLANASCPKEHQHERPFVELPPAYALWGRIMQMPHPPRQLSPLCKSNRPADKEKTPQIAIRSPAHNARYVFDPTIPPEYSTLSLEAETPPSLQALVWYANQREIGRTRWPHQMRWPLQRGRFRIVATSTDGRFRSPPIRILIR